MKFLNYLSSVKWPWLESQIFVGFHKKILITSAIALSILLSGKFRCFGVISATFQNQTCIEVRHACSEVVLNFIGVLGLAISLAGTPFVTGFFLATKSPALGGRITVHFTTIILMGCLATNFVLQPDSLLVTDSLIQGLGSSVILAILSIRLTELFPRDHKYHVLVSAFTDAGPWGTVLICPLFGVIIQVSHWQLVYLFFATFLVLIVLITTLIEPKIDVQTIVSVEYPDRPPTSTSEHDHSHGIHSQLSTASSSKCPDHPNETCDSYREVNEIEFWEAETSVYSVSSDERSEDFSCEHHSESHGNFLFQIPHASGFRDFFYNPETKAVILESTTIAWLIDRAIHSMVLYCIVLNLVDYMVTEINETLEKASLIMMSFGGGEVIGFIIATGLGDQLRHHLIHIYAISTGLLSVILFGWHMTQVFHIDKFSNGDAHFLALISGIVMSFCSSYTYTLAEDVINRPGIIAYPLTRLFQAFGLLFVPLTGGLVVQMSKFHSFFLVQSIFTLLRFIILCFIIYKMRMKRKELLKTLI